MLSNDGILPVTIGKISSRFSLKESSDILELLYIDQLTSKTVLKTLFHRLHIISIYSIATPHIIHLYLFR